MAKINGTLVAVLSGTDKVLYTTSATLNVKQNLFDTTNKESAGWAEHGNGLRDWDISLEGKYDTAEAGLTPNEILTAIIGRSADTAIKFVTDSPTNAAGWTGNGTFDSVSISGPMEDSVTWSAHIAGNGPLAAI